ncbi:MAG TPA: hypothetical protein DCS07_17500 [Bdellovibrionales bacterium]|nr:MAG: hypothetical protein A2Z97_09870 [Bdellovibrionales bacterium GWB1_52_6]OFZ04860.1 MAG: hypothetical protein A2X97_08760 [Bdellovibrionales bacterium GWA1_52_35]OFZ38335.1 MAG: hypothetical protein A2070_14935 [Bdellovibrionales bacterium GWC1_52_8]HAR44397.1 hypothetical protein [Bdellovibrionales bacterium]HCM38946.1 hypothetical protein [Bdellovibrionales bacterium]
MNLEKQTQPDPLYIIFEEHLYNFKDSDSDRRTFIGNIVIDYLTYLRKMNIIVPKAMEASVVEELGFQVNNMLVKKIYGFPNLDEYRKKAPKARKRKARTNYTKIKKSA